MFDIENDGKHIEKVAFGTTCDKHSADRGEPCWITFSETQEFALSGVCNRRAKAAGFNGKISSDSLARNRRA